MFRDERVVFSLRLENPDKEEKTIELETSDQSRATTPSINLDTMERLEMALDSAQEEAILEDTRIRHSQERGKNHSSRVKFLLTWNASLSEELKPKMSRDYM